MARLQAAVLLCLCLSAAVPAESTRGKMKAKTQADRVAIANALGFECGKNDKECATAVGFEKKLQEFQTLTLPAMEANPKIASTKAVNLYLHEEAAVKQYLFEDSKVTDSQCEGDSVFTHDASCRREHFALVAQGKCVPTKVINAWMKGKMAPPLDFDFQTDGGPFVAKLPPPKTPHGDSKDRRHAVQSMATYLRLHPELAYGNVVKELLYPVDLWDEVDEGVMSKARDHFKMLATRYRSQLEKAIANAGGIDNLSDEQKTLLEAVQEAGLSLNALANNQTMTELQEDTVMEAVVDLLSADPEELLEERVEEFEEDGSLVVSIVMWTIALAVPIGLLVFLRTRTSLLGRPHAPAKPGGSAGGLPRKAAGKTDASSPSATKPGALLRQLEEENMRLRQAVVNIPAGGDKGTD